MSCRSHRAFLIPALLAASWLATTLPASARERRTVRIEPYEFKLHDGTMLAAERGTFSVPEDRADPRSRRIEIGFVRFKSTNPRPGAPIVYLAGGPGGSGVAAARGPRQDIFLALRQVADVIALDQRGTGMSNQIPPCTAPERFDPAKVLTEQTLTAYYRRTLDYCAALWRKAGVAIGGYTTVQNAADIEDLRRAIGAPKLSLWGISYGTHLALATMRRYPASIDRVALASAEGTGQTIKLPASLDAVFARIDAMLDANAAPAPFRGLSARMRRVHAKFDAAPQSFVVKDGAGGTVMIRLDAFPLRMLAGFVPKNPDGIAQLAGAYAALDAGQGAAVAPLIYDYFYRRPLEMSGMPELMDIASGITDRRLAEVKTQAAAGAITGDATNFPMPQLRGAVVGLDLGDAFRREIRSAIPTLLLSGDLDVRTPVEEQAVAVAGLTRLHQVVVRNGGHDLFEADPRIAPMLVRFFAGQPTSEPSLTLAPPTLKTPGR